jgi:hypothetical protein
MSIRLYLKRQAVHPEAHSESRLVDRTLADIFEAMTTTVFVQDDDHTLVLGVNNLCRPGTLRPCLGEWTVVQNRQS